jgi:hypothetical protein
MAARDFNLHLKDTYPDASAALRAVEEQDARVVKARILRAKVSQRKHVRGGRRSACDGTIAVVDAYVSLTRGVDRHSASADGEGWPRRQMKLETDRRRARAGATVRHERNLARRLAVLGALCASIGGVASCGGASSNYIPTPSSCSSSTTSPVLPTPRGSGSSGSVHLDQSDGCRSVKVEPGELITIDLPTEGEPWAYPVLSRDGVLSVQNVAANRSLGVHLVFRAVSVGNTDIQLAGCPMNGEGADCVGWRVRVYVETS